MKYLGIVLAAGCLFGAAPIVSATVYTVGEGGTQAKIQTAIGLAVSAGGHNEIRVRQGVYAEKLNISSSLGPGESLHITGGWEEGFVNRRLDKTLTIVDGGDGGVPLAVQMSGGSLTVAYFTFRHGLTVNANGAGVQLKPTGSAQIFFDNNRVVNNSVTGSTNVMGGGIYALLPDDTLLYVQRCAVEGNTVPNANGIGAGIYVEAQEASEFHIELNTIQSNSVGGRCAGVFMTFTDAAAGQFFDNIVRSNVAASSFASGTCVSADTDATGSLVLRRNTWLENRSANTAGAQVHFSVFGGTLLLSDSLIAEGTGVGLFALAAGAEMTKVYATNVTIADNAGTGLSATAANGDIFVHNSIVSGNAFDGVGGASVTSNNLVGVDPHFVNAAAHDYRVYSDSPAINAGTNSPPGDLGQVDLGGTARTQDGTVDIGAYEGGVPIPTATPTVTPTITPGGPTLTPTATFTPGSPTVTPTVGTTVTGALPPRSNWPVLLVGLAGAMAVTSLRRRRRLT